MAGPDMRFSFDLDAVIGPLVRRDGFKGPGRSAGDQADVTGRRYGFVTSTSHAPDASPLAAPAARIAFLSVVGEGLDIRTLAEVPSAGRGQIRFELLNNAGPEAGRASFEELVTDIVKVIHPTAREVQPNPGDWGIDTFVGELDAGEIAIWQSKFFLNELGKAQQAQIRESFTSARTQAEARGQTISSWTLAIPSTMDGPMTVWWDNWVKRQRREHGIEVVLWQEADLRGLLYKDDFIDVAAQYFGPMPKPTGRDVEELDSPARYDASLFIKQLHAAGIKADGPARTAFFNAEVMTRDINERESERELKELGNVRSVLEQLWSTRFERARATCTEEDEGKLPSLYPDVCLAVENDHRANPNAVLRDTVVHRTGLVHHLAEDGRLGWVDHFADIAAAHDETTE